MSRLTEQNARNTKFIIVACFIIAALCIGFLITSDAKASEPSYEYNLVTDFIESDRKCATDEAMCERVAKLCPLVVARKAALYDFIWNKPPFRARNGGMNITARMDRAIRKCA
jgi:hypothetical protein